MTKHKSMLNNN